MNVPLLAPATSTSLASKPVTASEKVNVAVKSPVELIFPGTPPIVSVGATASHSAVTAASCAGTVFTPSVAASFVPVTVTSSPLVGVTVIVYIFPLPVNAPFLPPLTSTSAARKSVTSSENSNVTVRLEVEFILPGTPLIVSVGATASHSAVAASSATGPVFTPSVAEPAFTVTVTSSSPAGDTTSVYTDALVDLNAPLAPPSTITSAASKPVTSSEKVNITVKLTVELIFPGTPSIVSSGATASHSAVTTSSCTGPVFTPSVAEPAFTVTVTSFEPSGVTTSV